MRFLGEWGGSSIVYCYVVYCYNISGQMLSQLKLSPHPLLLRPHLLLLTNNLDILWKHREPPGVCPLIQYRDSWKHREPVVACPLIHTAIVT